MTQPPSERQPAVIDPRPGNLLGKYVSLVGSVLMELGDGLVEFEVPESERRFWKGAATVRLALVPEALDEDPESELIGIGSPAFECLIAGIRARGMLEDRGIIPANEDPSPEAATIPVPLDGVEAGRCRVEVMLLPVGRLLARVSIKAGPRLVERLVESPLVDLSTGSRLSGEIVAAVGDRHGDGIPDGGASVARRPPDELLPRLFDELGEELATDLARIQEAADSAKRTELARLSRYYQAMLGEVEAEGDPEAAAKAKRAIAAEHGRRRAEEEERYRVRVTVHPLQLTEWKVSVQRAVWPLSVPDGRSTDLTATRILAGGGAWNLSCVGCGRPPEAIRVCTAGHSCCPSCSDRCGVCSEMVCRSHGLAQCAFEGHPVCPEHARVCPSCIASHCSGHSAHCRVGDHEVCQTCAKLCGRCGTAICRAHGTETHKTAPLGARWLCSACTVYCEGGTNEPVGLDEVVRCVSCERHICQSHRVPCAVDDQPHCSRHLRRSDRTGRLICETHRSSCAEEPGSVLAADEVAACATCGRSICGVHGGRCDADGAIHCNSHLESLADRTGGRGCEKHRTACHIDGVNFTLAGTRACPVCGKPTCERHTVACGYCGRQVCAPDVEERRCLTCRRLEETADPADDLIQASLVASGGEPPKAKGWRTAQDASGTVVELDLGWTRRLVFSVQHGEMRPKTALQHSVLGTRRVR